MRIPDRSITIPVLSAMLLLLPVAGCGAGDEITNPGGTLPPIRTTTTLEASQTTMSPYYLHYRLKAGENLGMVANAFEVPLDVLIAENQETLGDNPSNLPIGTEIVIPPHRIIDSLPKVSTTTLPG